MPTRLRSLLRLAALAAWAALLLGFWIAARNVGPGVLELLLNTLDELSRHPLAPAGLLGLYLFRPFLLVPITVLNVASGVLLGAWPGIALAMVGTLLSATTGYGIGRYLGDPVLLDRLASRWRLVRLLRTHGFEAVVAGGLMYLHADAVNLPSGILRLPLRNFLAGILVGNSLTLATAVLAGASLEGGPEGRGIRIELEYIVLAAALFGASLLVARRLRKRLTGEVQR